MQWFALTPPINWKVDLCYLFSPLTELFPSILVWHFSKTYINNSGPRSELQTTNSPAPGSSSAALSPKLPGHHPGGRKQVGWVHAELRGHGHGRGLSDVQYTTSTCCDSDQALRGVELSEIREQRQWGTAWDTSSDESKHKPLSYHLFQLHNGRTSLPPSTLFL